MQAPSPPGSPVPGLLPGEQRPGLSTACDTPRTSQAQRSTQPCPQPGCPKLRWRFRNTQPEMGVISKAQGAEQCSAPPSQRRGPVLPRALLAKKRHPHICCPGVMRPLLRGPAGNDEEESSDSTPLLPSARQTEAGEPRDHREQRSGRTGGSWPWAPQESGCGVGGQVAGVAP